MITYAERSCFYTTQQRIFRRAQDLVARVSDARGNELRCHELARGLQLVIRDEVSLRVVDGHCGPVEHSWLVFADGVILDSYVPGRLPAVQLVDSLVGALYRPGNPRRDVKWSLVDELVREMRSPL
jgi:hypothetical protein